MKRLLIFSLALSACLAVAQNMPGTVKLTKQAFSKRALQRPAGAPTGPVQGPFFVSTETAPMGDTNLIVGVLNPSLEDFEEPEGGRYTIKPGDKLPDFKQVNTLASGDSLAFVNSFDTLGQTPLSPPDTEGAAGLHHVVNMVNSRFAIYDKCGVQQYANNLANITPAPWNGHFIFDPKIVFDPWNNRWVMMMHARDSGTQDANMLIYVSDDSDPNGTWWVYVINMNWIYGGNRTWADYYDLGYGVTGIYFTGNQYTYGNAYQGSTMAILQKAQLYAHAAAGVVYKSGLDFAPRVADMYYGPAAATADVFTIASNSGGGNTMFVSKVVDPFGASTLTRNVVGTAAYALAPAAGTIGFSFDCRLMDARFTRDLTRNKYHMYTACNANSSGEMGVFAIDIDPIALSQTNATMWGYGAGWDMAMACPNPDYSGNMALSYSVGGPGVFPRCDTLVTDDNVYQGFFVVANGQSANGSGRWGDYAGGSMDWGDYYFGNSGKRRLWGAAERMGTGGNWQTHMNAVVGNGVTPGILAVSGGNVSFSDGVGGVSAHTTSWTMSNTGEVGIEWQVSKNVNWIDITTATRGSIYGASTVNATVQTNANANALPYGYHTATVTFRNCLNGATINRTYSLSLGKWMCPDAVFMYEGFEFAGGIAAVCTQDGVYQSFFNDDSSLATDLFYQFSGLIDSPGSVYSYPYLRVLRPGLSVQCWFWQSEVPYGWIASSGGVASTTGAYVFCSNANADGRFIHPNGQAWVRVRTQPINDEDPSQDGWLTQIDWLNFWHYPTP